MFLLIMQLQTIIAWVWGKLKIDFNLWRWLGEFDGRTENEKVIKVWNDESRNKFPPFKKMLQEHYYRTFQSVIMEHFLMA